MKSSNCPNCGAPLKGATCEYCGSFFPERAIPQQTYFDPYSQLSQTCMNLQMQLNLAQAQTQISQIEQSRYVLSMMNAWRP